MKKIWRNLSVTFRSTGDCYPNHFWEFQFFFFDELEKKYLRNSAGKWIMIQVTSKCIYDINSHFRAIQIFIEYQMPIFFIFFFKKTLKSTCHLTVTDWVVFSVAIDHYSALHARSAATQWRLNLLNSFTLYEIISQRILLFHVWRHFNEED